MYHKWFKGFVSIWFELAQSKAKERLHNAVELDTVANYTDQACFSSSAVDAHGMFLQVSVVGVVVYNGCGIRTTET